MARETIQNWQDGYYTYPLLMLSTLRRRFRQQAMFARLFRREKKWIDHNTYLVLTKQIMFIYDYVVVTLTVAALSGASFTTRKKRCPEGHAYSSRVQFSYAPWRCESNILAFCY